MEKQQLIIVLALIIDNQGKILLARRNEPGDHTIHNKLEFIGGKVEFGEDPETAVIREAMEEAGVNIKVIRLLPKIYSNTWEATSVKDTYQVFLLPYECRIVSGELKAEDDEVKDLKYYSLDEIDYENALPKVKEIIELLKL